MGLRYKIFLLVLFSSVSCDQVRDQFYKFFPAFNPSAQNKPAEGELTADKKEEVADNQNSELLKIFHNQMFAFPSEKFNNIQHFVYKAKQHLEKDYSKAIEDFKTDQWTNDKTHIFIFDKMGTSLFSSHRPEVIGKNLSNWTDLTGKKPVIASISVAEKGGGFVNFFIEGKKSQAVILRANFVLPFVKKDGTELLVGSSFSIFQKEKPAEGQVIAPTAGSLPSVRNKAGEDSKAGSLPSVRNKTADAPKAGSLSSEQNKVEEDQNSIAPGEEKK